MRSAQSVEEALRDIESKSHATVGHFETIAQSVDEQNATTQNVAAHISRIANVSAENDAVAQTTSTVSEKLAETANRLDLVLKRFTV